MPIYRYGCVDCAHEVELIQKMSEKAPPESCEKCGCSEFNTLVGAPMFVLKGRGWSPDAYHYVKTPADTLPGYSDQDKHTILPNRKATPVTPPKPMPFIEESKPISASDAPEV